MPHAAAQPHSVDGARPDWFAAFLADRGTRKPSAHTLKAYRQDFDAIAPSSPVARTCPRMSLGDITTDTMRTAFARYAETHEAASIRRCWSTWNVLCTFLYTSDLIPANPMPLVGRPKLAKTLPKALPADAVTALLAALTRIRSRGGARDWIERDRALILTALLAGLRADELLRANVGDLRRTDDGAVIHVRGKGGKDRRIPIEPALVDVIEDYLDTRAARFPARPSGAPPPAGDWPPGRRRRRCSWAPTVSASPAAPCNTGCCGRFAAPASTPTAPAAHSCTGCATPSPPSSPTPTSASTP